MTARRPDAGAAAVPDRSFHFTASGVAHFLLGGASFIPGPLGAIASAADGIVYAAQGDKVNAGISFGAAALGLVSDAGGVKLAAMGLAEGVKAARIANESKTVLGHFPEYVEMAEQLGARKFQVPSSIWEKMSSAEQWAANQKFLDRTISRGEDVILATPLNKVRPGSSYERELQYMMEKGYKPDVAGTKLLPPAGR